MPRQVVIAMTDAYPFGECEEGDDQAVRVLVRRRLPLSPASRESLLARTHLFRRLNQSCIVRLEQVLEEEDGLQLLYEYVPIRMQTWISNINEKFIEGFCRQLAELGDYLAKCYIKVELRLDCVGMDENYRPKYFLDLDFAQDESQDKAALRANYQQQILSLFRPYIHKLAPPALPAPRPQPKWMPKPPPFPKERKNESINVNSQFELMTSERNRKQSILSSVSNVKIHRLGRRIDEIKSQLRHIHSPEPQYHRHEERSVQKKDHAIAFKYDSTERVVAGRSAAGMDSAAFCQNILRDFQQEEGMIQKFEQNLARQLCKGLPLKKNETLKAKEYEQMTRSDDGYFKDFFNVLEDKPNKGQLALPPSEDRRAEMLALPPSRHDERRPNLNNDRLIQNERLALTNGPDRRPID